MNMPLSADELIQRYLDGMATASEIDALERQLTASPEVADAFVEAAWFDTLLQMSAVNGQHVANLELSITTSLGPVLEHSRQVAEQMSIEAAEPEEFGLPAVPVLDRLSRTMCRLTQIGVLPYLAFAAAMLVFCLGAQLLWEWGASDGQPVAQVAPGAGGTQASSPVFVARITGISGCRWAEGSSRTAYFERVAIGRQFKLNAGLLEITYDSGAKVILQGPVDYEVSGDNRGRLTAGRVTGLVTTERARGFLIDTPTAHVLDLGTEFGVEVNPQGVTTSQVYRGSVRLQAVEQERAMETACVLEENQAARVETGSDLRPAIQPAEADPTAFVRSVPAGVSIGLFGTGVGVNVGEPDPHWQIVALSGQDDFSPVAATVIPGLAQAAKDPNWVIDSPETSQWISLPGGVAPNGATCTFRTTFDVTGVHLETAGLLGRFIVDDHVRAIRLNGREIPVPTHGYDAVWERSFVAFEIAEGFIEGRNVLEIEVENSNQRDTTKANQMGLRLEVLAVAEGRDTRSGK